MLTLKSFKSQSDNLRFDGGEPSITYTLTGFESDKHEVEIEVDFVSEETLDDDYYNDEYFKNSKLGPYDILTVKGSCKFTVDADAFTEDFGGKECRIETDEFNSIEGKIQSIKFDTANFTEEEAKDMEEKLYAFYRENLKYELNMIASYCRLFMI